MKKNRLLIIGGVASAVISLLHIAIIIGGPDWYRIFGAGEGMAQLAEVNPTNSSIITGIIALVFALWAVYAFSGAGIIIRLPLLNFVLLIISVIYILRGILGIPSVLYIDHPYLNELEGMLIFMITSSIISLGVGIVHLIGVKQIWHNNQSRLYMH